MVKGVITMTDRVQHNADGSLDEVVVSACDVHLEHMNDGAWWIGITRDGKTMHLWLVNDKRGRPTVTVTDDEIGIPVTHEG